LLTVTVGNANVGVGVIVGDGVMIGVNVIVGVNINVGVDVNVGMGVLVHALTVAVMGIAVNVACSLGKSPQAKMNNTISKAR
jgi:UDP-3-O-[3-hydroxymyristoyl] glucosamine N-acyltransferase